MDVEPTIRRCGHCGERGSVQPVTERLERCRACGFLRPQPRPVTRGPLTGTPALLGAIAPSGVLRNKYRLIERLGEGAHGISYLAEHEYLSHPCVVKILPHRIGDAADNAVRRLRSEARAGFSVDDPNVVRVLDCDVVHGVWYFVMEYVDGVNLAEILAAKQRLNWLQAVRVGTDAADGLTAIHRAGILHRDIKPGNLILGTDGRVRVADLGVATLAHERVDVAVGAGSPAGTLGYAAPEVFRTDVQAGPPADLYSLGATLFHLLTGRLPHAGSQVFQRLMDLQCQRVAWPEELTEEVPPWLVDVLLRLLAIEPGERFESAAELTARLKLPADESVRRRPVVQLDKLQPRGVGVLPFANEQDTPDDDWLGYAVANYLSRALAEAPDVYVADQDGLVAMVQRMEAGALVGATERLREAGRLVGAATIVTGRFQRAGERVILWMEALRSGRGVSERVARVEGELVELPKLERALFERLAHVLGLGRREGERPRAVTLGAREKFVLAKQAYLRGEYEHAIALGEEAVRLAPEFAEAIGFVGVCLARIGRYDDAEVHHRRQETLARQWGDVRRQVEALANLGAMNYFRGNYEAAETQFVQAGAMAEQLGLATEHAQISNNLGFVLFRRGRLADAEKAFLRAIEAHRAYGGLTLLVGPYNGMGNVLAEQQRYDEARSYYQRALALARETEDRTSVGTTHMHLGRCAAQQGHFADAKHEFTMALNALEETRFWNGLGRAYEYIAEMHLQAGTHEEALRCADKRIELARQHSNVRMEAAAWLQKAESLRRAGREAEAVACEERGRDLGAVPAPAG